MTTDFTSGAPTLTHQNNPASQPLPNLFLIGASKSGSSALHAYLSLHPDISASLEKEPCYFVDQAELETAWPIRARHAHSHDLEAYLSLWPNAESARYRVEGSVYYSQAPHRSGVPERIAKMCPDARIIYVVRNPVDRAVAHYWQRFKEFQEPLPLDRAVKENTLYRDTSDYALQLGMYLEHFDRSQIYIVVAEDLRRNRRETLSNLFDWLGLPFPELSDQDLRDRHVSPKTSRRTRFPFVRAVRDSAIWAQLRKILPSVAVDRLRRAATVSFAKGDVDEAQARAWLKAELAPRQRAFEVILGRKVPDWT